MEQEITEDRLFESVLRRLSTSAFTCVVRCGVRDIDTFLKLDPAEFTETKPGTVQELSSAQQWARGQLGDTNSADTAAKPTDFPIADTEPNKEPEQTVDAEDDSEILRLILDSLGVRARHALAYGHVKKLPEFMRLEPDVMAGWPNTGAKTIAEILNIQKRLNDLVRQCKEQGKQLDVRAVCRLLNQPTRTPRQRIGQTVSIKGPAPLTPVEHSVDEPALWSVLRKTMPDLLSIGGHALDALRAATENQCISDVVSLPASDWDRLAAATIYGHDDFDALLAITVGYLVQMQISSQAYDAIVDSVISLVETAENPRPHRPGVAACNHCIVTDADIRTVRNFRVDSFDVPQEYVKNLRARSIHTWGDLTALSEESVIESAGPCMEALREIQVLWRMRLYAQLARDELDDLPAESCSSFGRMLESFVGLVAKNDKDRTIALGRIGLIGDHKATYDELGGVLGLTRARVQQLWKRRADKLKSLAALGRPSRFWFAVFEVISLSGGACLLGELAAGVATRLGWDQAPGPVALASMLRFRSDLEIDSRQSIVREPAANCLHCETIASAMTALFAEDKNEKLLEDVAESLASVCRQQPDCTERRSPRFSEGYLRTIADGTQGVMIDDGVVYYKDAGGARRGSRVQLVESILKSAGRPMHFSEVCQQAKILLPDDTRITEHNVYSWIGNSANLLLWDRGTYVHRDQVEIPDELIGEVERWLEKRLESGVPFVSIAGAYSAFEGQLAEAGISSESALYSCLRQSRNDLLSYPRYPYVVPNRPGSERLPVSIALEQYALDAGGLVSFKEMKTYAIEELCIAEQMFAIHIYNVPNLIRAGKGQYIHVENLKLDRGRLETVLGHATNLLSSEGHVSVEKVYSDKQISCKTMGIDSAEMLYAVLQAHAHATMQLPGYPQIVSVNYRGANGGSRGVLDEVCDYIALRESPCSFDELEQHFADELGYNIGTVYNVIIRDSVVRYSRGSLIHLDTLDWTEDKQRTIEAEARTVIDQAHRAGRCYGLVSHLLEYGRLPRLDNDVVWTQTLLAELLARSGGFRVLGSTRNALIALPNEVGVETFEDLVCELLRTRYGGACDLESFEEDMRTAGIVQKRVTPGMLGDQERAVIAGHLIMLRELYVDAT